MKKVFRINNLGITVSQHGLRRVVSKGSDVICQCKGTCKDVQECLLTTIKAQEKFTDLTDRTAVDDYIAKTGQFAPVDAKSRTISEKLEVPNAKQIASMDLLEINTITRMCSESALRNLGIKIREK